MVQNFCFKYNMADLFAIFSRKASKICFRAPEATFWFQVLTGGQLLLLRRMPSPTPVQELMWLPPNSHKPWPGAERVGQTALTAAGPWSGILVSLQSLSSHRRQSNHSHWRHLRHLSTLTGVTDDPNVHWNLLSPPKSQVSGLNEVYQLVIVCRTSWPATQLWHRPTQL